MLDCEQSVMPYWCVLVSTSFACRWKCVCVYSQDVRLWRSLRNIYPAFLLYSGGNWGSCLRSPSYGRARYRTQISCFLLKVLSTKARCTMCARVCVRARTRACARMHAHVCILTLHSHCIYMLFYCLWVELIFNCFYQ